MSMRELVEVSEFAAARYIMVALWLLTQHKWVIGTAGTFVPASAGAQCSRFSAVSPDKELTIL